jgi:hypothetical protein
MKRATIAILAFASASALSLAAADTARATVGWESSGWHFSNTFTSFYGSGGQGVSYVVNDPPWGPALRTETAPETASTYNWAETFCAGDGSPSTDVWGSEAGPGFAGCSGNVGDVRCESITPTCPANTAFNQGQAWVFQNR